MNNLCVLIIKSFIRKKKFLKAISVLCCVSMIVLLMFNYFTEVSMKITQESIEQDCGKYDIVIGNIDDSSIQMIFEQNDLISYIKYMEKEICHGDINYRFVYSTEEYLDFTSFCRIEGEYPKNEDEINCETWMLRQMGISSENMLGSIINIAGKNYRVTGLITNKAYSMPEESVATILCKETHDKNMLMLEMGCVITDDTIEELLNNLSQNQELMIGRNFDKEVLAEEAKETTNVTRFFVLIIIVISAILIFVNCIYLYVNNIRHDINTYMQLGMKKQYLIISLQCTITVIALVCNLAGSIIYGAVSKIIYRLCFIDNEVGYTYDLVDVMSHNNVKLFFSVCVVEVIILSVVLYGIFYRKFCRLNGTVGKAYDTNFKTKEINNNRIYLLMAKNNLKMSFKNNLVMLVTVVFSLMAFVGIYYYIESVTNSGVDFGDTKYIIDFKDDYLLSEKDVIEKERIVDELLSNKVVEATTQNVFYTFGNISKHNVSENLKTYLSQFADYNAAMNNGIIDTVPILFGIISETQMNMYENVSLEGKNAILYNCTTSIKIEESLNVEKDNIVQVKNHKNENIDVVLSDVREKCPFEVYTESVAIILVVNDIVFDEISNHQKADKIYISGDVTEDDLLDHIGHANFLQIENLEFDQKSINKNLVKIKFVLGLLLLVCLISLFITLTVICIIRISVFEKEYNTLYAIGIPLKMVIRVPIYEFLLITIPIFACSIMGSYVVTKVMYVLLSVDYNVLYRFPIDAFVIVFVLLQSIECICSIIAIRKIKNVCQI